MTDNPNSTNDRRDFLKTCGKFAVVTPPAVTALLSTSLTGQALAYSSGGKSTPPGWSMGEKTGWGGFSEPPKKSRIAPLQKSKNEPSKEPKIAARGEQKHK